MGGASSFGIGKDFLMLIVAFVALVAVATRLYPSIVT
jgi:hypothetical protein